MKTIDLNKFDFDMETADYQWETIKKEQAKLGTERAKLMEQLSKLRDANREYKTDLYDIASKREELKRDKLDSFLNSLKPAKVMFYVDNDLDIVSLQSSRLSTCDRDKYNKYLTQIREGFKSIFDMKMKLIHHCIKENLELSEYFYTTEKRMNRELEKREKNRNSNR